MRIDVLFRQCAARWPDRLAVAVGPDRLTYRALARRVGELKQTGLVVGCYDHCTDGVAAFLAALDSGSTYVPLSPVQGRARIDTIRQTVANVTVDDDVAYIIYTSGSSGTPKGVVIGHAALAASTAARRDLYGAVETLFLAAPFCFDSSIAMFGPLTSGGAVRFASPAARHDIVRLAAEAASCSHALILPSLYGEMLEVWGSGQPRGLRVVTVAGEALAPALVRRHFELAPWRRLVNEYGPTEATVFCTAHDCRPEDAEAAVVPIGTAVTGYRVSVEKDELGEIWVGGPGLADGYLGDPALTAAKFVTTDTGRWYRTGDLGLQRADGTIEYHGRVDEQVKIRGVRVELTEVDSLLRGLPGVAAAAAAQIDGRLIGFVQAVPGGLIDTGETRGLLRGMGAPDFLIPQAIEVVDRLPRTANGKVDRRALRVEMPRVAPSGGTGVLARACREVLGADIDPDLPFVAFGDSLAAMRVGVRLHNAGWTLDPVTLLDGRPLSSVAPRPFSPTAVTPPDGRLSPIERGIWYAANAAGGTAYLVPLRISLDGRLEPQRLAAAVAAVVRRHPVLGCRIDSSLVWTPTGEPPAVHLIELFAGESTDEIAAEEAELPIDLHSEAPLRVVLVRPETGPDELLITLHHIAFDGWSKPILLRDLTAAYRGETLPAPPPRIRVADQDGTAAAALLEKTPHVLSLRSSDSVAQSRPRVLSRRSGEGAAQPQGFIFDVDPRLRQSLEELARSRDTTVFTVLLAGFGLGLHRHTGQPEFIIGTATANRPDPATHDAVGMFTNVVPVALAMTAADPILHTRQRLLAALRFSGVPFANVVEAAVRERDPRFAPLVQVMFEYFGQETEALGFGAVTGILRDDELQQGAVCDLSLRVFPRGGGFRGVAVYDRSVVTATTAHQVIDAALLAWRDLCR